MSIEITIEKDIDVVCSRCGNVLETDWNTRKNKLTVTPCEECLADAEEKGKDCYYEAN